MGKMCAFYNYPVPDVQVVGTARRDVSRKNGQGVGKGVRVSLPHHHSLIFLRLSYFAPHSTNSTLGIGYSTNKPIGFPRLHKNKTKQT